MVPSVVPPVVSVVAVAQTVTSPPPLEKLCPQSYNMFSSSFHHHLIYKKFKFTYQSCVAKAKLTKYIAMTSTPVDKIIHQQFITPLQFYYITINFFLFYSITLPKGLVFSGRPALNIV